MANKVTVINETQGRVVEVEISDARQVWVLRAEKYTPTGFDTPVVTLKIEMPQPLYASRLPSEGILRAIEDKLRAALDTELGRWAL